MHKKEYSVVFINRNAAAEMQRAASRPAELMFRDCLSAGNWSTDFEETGDVSQMFVLVTFL